MVQKPLSYLVWEVHAHPGAQQLHPPSSSCRSKLPVLLVGPCRKHHLCKYIFAELKFQGRNPQSFHLLFGITENVETEKLYGRDSEKYNWLLTASCYCMSMGNKYQTCVFESLPDVICLELQSTHQKHSPGIAYHCVLALITTERFAAPRTHTWCVSGSC